LAAQLYASGSVRSKKEAAEIAGIHPVWFLAMSNHNEPTQRLMNSMSEKILDESVDASKLLKTIGRKALARIVDLMETSGNEKIALEAAKDLADRSSETMKTQRLEVASLTLGPDEARQLAAALVESNRGRAELEHVAKDGLIEVSAEALPSVSPESMATRDRTGLTKGANPEALGQPGSRPVAASTPRSLPSTLALVPDHDRSDIQDRIPSDTGEATDGAS
jgi:hypothetical protein